MTTRSDVKNTLLVVFCQNFNTSIPVSFTNKNSFYKCQGSSNPISVSKETNSPWVRFWVQNNKSNTGTIGASPSRRYERMGMIAAQVFIPEGSGTYNGDILCEEIINIFEGKRFGNIHCNQGEYREVGNVEDGYFTYDVTIYFEFDECK